MCLCNIQQLLKMLIQHVQNGMCKSPQEKERSYQYKRNKILFPYQRYSFLFHNIIISDNLYQSINAAAKISNKKNCVINNTVSLRSKSYNISLPQ